MNDDNQQTVPLLGSSLSYSAGIPSSGDNQQHVRIVNNLAMAATKTNIAVTPTDDDSDCDTITSRTLLKKKTEFVLPAPSNADVENRKNDPEADQTDKANCTTPLNPNNQKNGSPSFTDRLKDKISNAVPNVIQKKPREYKLKAFVGFLFLLVVFLVGFAYIFYYQQLARKTYFERIRFTKEDRIIRVYDDYGLEALRGHMGASFPTSQKSYKCHERDRPPNSTLCLEWMGRGRLSLAQTPNKNQDDKSRCYRVIWQSLSADTYPTDCYEMNNQLWFGAGAVLGQQHDFAGWPLNRAEVPISPFVTGSEVRGHNGWGQVLRRYFMNSKAAAIIVDDSTPLWVSVNANQSQLLCLQSRSSGFPFFDHGEESIVSNTSTKRNGTKNNPIVHSVLNYTICTAADLETLLTSLADAWWDGLRKDEMEVVKKLMEDPVWRFQPRADDNQTVQSLMKYTNSIVGSVWTSPGYLLIDTPWEERTGDLEFDPNRFQGLSEALEIIHRKGFKVAVTVRPFVSTFSKTYKSGLDFQLSNSSADSVGTWIRQPYGEGSPALTSYNGDHSLALADVTSRNISEWVADHLNTLIKNYELDGIFFESVTADYLPHYYVTAKPLTDPSKLSSLWVDAARQVTTVLSVTSATQMPRLPTFVAIPRLPSTWEGLTHLLPLVLTLSVSGYPFLIPPPVGGISNLTKPDKELYIRWLQVSTFLPVMQFATIPSSYDAEVERMASNLTGLRQSTVLPILQRYGGSSVFDGLPIIRPLWMLDPFDKEGLDVADEFCVGDELLVAPVLEPGAREREVYLPKGVWKDGIDGSLRKGGRWIHHYRAKLDQVPFFTRAAEGTRL
ncbi:myogenesis-regulating glycosidase isoform X2 [Daphnia magna]|uniref:Myogenesis-regulating glycosidase n=1 Tax=Daphnia magna TaxID=35525 RepID=A0ABR0AXB1_9CRUS|nr:myogenesis-regulating glycosidase isoform X2 [Daphnia magna]KAK4029770.1 hypothetical protein OUZ56_022734 [Daphnia magna]